MRGAVMGVIVSKTFGVLALAVLLCGWGGPAHAQKIFEQFNKPLKPVAEPIPEADFLANSKLIDEQVKGDTSLAYSIRIPKDWTVSGDSLGVRVSRDNNLLGEIGRFFGPSRMDGERSNLTINTMGVSYKMSARQWMVQYLLSMGYSLQGMAERNDRVVEAVYVMLKDGETFVVRALVWMNGRRAVLAQYAVPIDLWDGEKAQAERVLASFRLKKTTTEDVEQMSVYKFLDIAEMKYPTSWKLTTPPVKSVERIAVNLMIFGKATTEEEVKDKLDGKIDVELVSIFSTNSLDEEIERYRSDVEKTGLLVQGEIETPADFVLSPQYDFAETHVYKASDSSGQNKLIDYEYWLTVLSAGDYYYFISLLTPGRDQNYFVWARNTETYRALMYDFDPQEQSLTDDDEE